MINITCKKLDNQLWIRFKGHTQPDICAAASSIMYTTVNAINKYNNLCLSFFDDNINDEVEVLISDFDDVINLLIDNMFDMFNDLIEDGNENKIRIIRS